MVPEDVPLPFVMDQLESAARGGARFSFSRSVPADINLDTEIWLI
jgi:hypothetical protein